MPTVTVRVAVQTVNLHITVPTVTMHVAVPDAFVHAVRAKPSCFALALASGGRACSTFPTAEHFRAEPFTVVALQTGPATVTDAVPCRVTVCVTAAVRAAVDADTPAQTLQYACALARSPSDLQI